MTPPAIRGIHRTLLVGALALGASAAPAMAATPLSRAELAGRAQLLKEMNKARVSHGVRPLRLSTILTRPAVTHSRFLARTGLLTHNGSDGRPFYVRLYKAGYSRRRAVGENLGMIGGCSTNVSKLMVQMWLESPSHRRNLLDPHFKVVGLAVVKAKNCDQTVYTTDFGG